MWAVSESVGAMVDIKYNWHSTQAGSQAGSQGSVDPRQDVAACPCSMPVIYVVMTSGLIFMITATSCQPPPPCKSPATGLHPFFINLTQSIAACLSMVY